MSENETNDAAELAGMAAFEVQRHAVAHAAAVAMAAAGNKADAADIEHEDTSGLSRAELMSDAALDELCEDWAWWCATRGYYGPPPVSAHILGRLQKRASVRKPNGGPDSFCSADLLALHLAILGQGENSLDCAVFRLHYLYRVRNVKAASSALGISRQHWYRLLREFRRRVHRISQRLRAEAQSDYERLASVRAAAEPVA